MAGPLDEPADAPALPTREEFRLHRFASRASTLGISSTSRRMPQPQPTLQRAHTIQQSNSARRTGRPLIDREKRHQQQTPSSLVRVKTSNQGLRNRSFTHEITSVARRDNNFAVANVGNNGKLYLRPLVEPSSRRRHGKSLQKATLAIPTNSTKLSTPEPVDGPDARHSVWSSSQFSEIRPKYAEEKISEIDGDLSDTEPRRTRAHSFSTISEYERSAPSDAGDEFRIVIDRFDTNDESVYNNSNAAPSMPALEVPIPHYRLGTLQFNTDGTPVLRSSVYTRTSVSEHTDSFIYLKDNLDVGNQIRIPSTYDSPGLTAPEGTLSVAMSLFSGVPQSANERNSTSTHMSGVYALRHPIDPSIFDRLAENMDDPAVVKYIPNTRDISAATPARIVVQISSESFMDYELVSDFFLTFRSYLSTKNLLGLLLARLEWAISRPQADGRIIRIRTFAALRHWILNYFVDDFVNNRALRVQFCDQINAMYDDVKARTTAGVSDVKILADLKRCWHGRCTMYWDTLPLTSPNDAALPGGLQSFNNGSLSDAGSSSQDGVRGSIFSNQSLVHSMNSNLSTDAERTPVPQALHSRKISSGTSKSVPGSSSEQSVQALSCSLPAKSASMPMSAVDAPHPVVVSLQMSPVGHMDLAPRSPASSGTPRHPAHHHKRSGSFSDSIRDDRAPLSRASVKRNGHEQALLPASGDGNDSLIRGNVFPPTDASVAAIAPPSPSIVQISDELREHARSASEGNIRPQGASPGLKTVIGSIRRALHAKNMGTNSSSHAEPRYLRSQRGKTATLPVNVSFKSDIYKDRKPLSKSNTPPRTDHISEQSMKDYREAIGLNPPQALPSFTIQTPGGLEDQLSPSSMHNVKHQRLVSEVTMGSKSIVIVDDTGLDIPVASGGINWLDHVQTSNPSSRSQSWMTESHSLSAGTGMVPVAASPEIFNHQKETFPRSPFGHPLHLQPNTPDRNSSRSMASRLRKYASFHSGISRSLGPASDTASLEAGDKPLSRLLRRRPGGDLRKIQNVHDLAPELRPQSFATDTSLTESLTSARNYFRRSFSRYSQARTQSTPPRFDLINTHSSQHLRPSFEAAIAGFSNIPDDTDGGIESTLLKLEGKWPSPSLSDDNTERKEGHDSEALNYYDDDEHVIGASRTPTNIVDKPFGESIAVRNHEMLPPQSYTNSVIESEFSYNSIPLLERGLSDDSMKKPVIASKASITPNHSVLRSPSSTSLESSHLSVPVHHQTERDQGGTQPAATHAELPPINRLTAENRDQSDNRSELSSEVSVDLIDRDEALERYSNAESLSAQSSEIPSHAIAHPPSPPFTIHQPTPNSPHPEAENVSTPGPSSNDVFENSRLENTKVRKKAVGLHIDVPKPPSHVPFILAYDSRLLAQQFTVVEKSALDEVDWKDLVDMKWNNKSASIVSWVHFLAEKEHKGIDIVVGRFNLMVKWILSEVVLTLNMQERARTITKFIHIAAHARQMCNYSTMLQIAIALSSVDCTRLHRTWSLVGEGDKQLLHSMESLIQPLRNFHELRVEMETANLQNGCIPFVGLYVHDLTYNAQKPSQVSGTREGDALVNFERYRTSARIVKCLLRLIDASNKYNLEPVPGIVEKCLWIGSLPEDQIQTFSQNLE